MMDSLKPYFDLQLLSDLLARGGPIVAILCVLSVVALAVVVLKAFQFIYCGIGSNGGAERAITEWIAGRSDTAIQHLAQHRNPTAVVLAHAMQGEARGIERSVVREDAERVALEQLSQLRGGLRILEATAQIAPLLGLFGTVIGMMEAFQALQQAGATSDPAALAGGIWVALITTAVGLAVAIPAAFSLYWFEGRIDREKSRMEAALTSLFTRRLSGAPPVQRPEGLFRAAE